MVRHARATKVEVDVMVDDRNITLTVCDNGVGLAAVHRPQGRGLENVATRARRLGGSFDLRLRPEGGTLAVWSVPVGDERRQGQAGDRRPVMCSVETETKR